jgi:hypothetical protein
VYSAVNAKNEWITLGGSANGIPLEPELGAHWDELWFDSELMTPVAEGTAAAHPLSRVTVGALLDLGWSADLSAADVYALPMCAGACTAPSRAARLGEGAFGDDAVIERLLPLRAGPPGRR